MNKIYDRYFKIQIVQTQIRTAKASLGLGQGKKEGSCNSVIKSSLLFSSSAGDRT